MVPYAQKLVQQIHQPIETQPKLTMSLLSSLQSLIWKLCSLSVEYNLVGFQSTIIENVHWKLYQILDHQDYYNHKDLRFDRKFKRIKCYKNDLCEIHENVN